MSIGSAIGSSIVRSIGLAIAGGGDTPLPANAITTDAVDLITTDAADTVTTD